jgi:hypothetical protein
MNYEWWMVNWRLIFKVGWIVLLLAGCAAGPEGEPTAVAPNGIPVAAEFQDFYAAYGGADVLGEPVTEFFTAGEGERPLQYFQNIRLEYDAATDGVIITPLGNWGLAGLHEQIPAQAPESSVSRLFPETGYTVQDEFLRFYEAYNGEVLLGQPISPQLNVDGVRMQYFENGRLDWRPEATAERRVQLGRLGRAHFDDEMAFAYQDVQPRPVSSAGVDEVEVEAYVKAPILYEGEEQLLYVTVLTPEGNPVSGAVVEVSVSFDGKTGAVRSTATNDLGQVIVPLNFDIPPGQQVVLHLTALNSNGRPLGETMLTYKTWW